MTNKNPFEIRLEIMKMAKEMMDTQYHDAMNGWWQVVSSYAEAHNTTTDELLKKTDELMKAKPMMYTPKDIMEKAQELYGFVAKKD
jgi:adenosylmethionine-8-amino-7-oxononanoate aminotransferase